MIFPNYRRGMGGLCDGYGGVQRPETKFANLSKFLLLNFQVLCFYVKSNH